MSHTNSTTNYSLPQFVTTDKPAWLTDINGAFSDIDTAVKNVSNTATSAASDASDALTNAGTALSAANGADTKASGAVASIGSAFDTTSTYAVGDYVIYNNLLYKCIAAVTTPGTWTGITNWDRAIVGDVLETHTGAIATNASDISALQLAVAGIPDINQETITATTNSSGMINPQRSTTSGQYILSATPVTGSGGYYAVTQLTSTGTWFLTIKDVGTNNNIANTSVSVKVVTYTI